MMSPILPRRGLAAATILAFAAARTTLLLTAWPCLTFAVPQEKILSDEELHIARTSTALRRTVQWLSAPQRSGRRAGTQGALDSALWIASQLRNYHMLPGGDDEYLQPFGVPLPVADGGESWIDALHRIEGAQQLVPLASSAPGKVRGRIEFHGLGIESETPSWHDYPDVLPADTVVLLLQAGPAGAPEATYFDRVATAVSHGAVGVLFAPHPDSPMEALEAFHPGLRGPVPALRIRLEVALALYPGYSDAARASGLASLGEGAMPAAASLEPIEMFANVDRSTAVAYNVLARIPGGDGPTVLLGAHFDHLGRGGLGSLAPELQGDIHPGADDNSSGIAVLFEVMSILLDAGTPPGDILFAFWSGHASGSLGSRHWCAEPSVPLESIAAYVNLDSVGRAGDGQLQVLGAGSSPAFAGWLAEAGELVELELQPELSYAGIGGSDAWSFLARQVPSLHLSSGLHGDSHRPSDHLRGFEAEGAVHVVDLVIDLVARIQAADDLPFRALEAPTTEDKPSTPAHLGIVADGAFAGPGLLLRTTTGGGSAASAGLLPGDVLLEVGDVSIEDESSLRHLEQLYLPGDVVLVRFLRGGHERLLRMTLLP